MSLLRLFSHTNVLMTFSWIYWMMLDVEQKLNRHRMRQSINQFPYILIHLLRADFRYFLPICSLKYHLFALLFQDSMSWMPYLSYVCILAVIASFCSGPGKSTHPHHCLCFFPLLFLAVSFSAPQFHFGAPLHLELHLKEIE